MVGSFGEDAAGDPGNSLRIAQFAENRQAFEAEVFGVLIIPYPFGNSA